MVWGRWWRGQRTAEASEGQPCGWQTTAGRVSTHHYSYSHFGDGYTAKTAPSPTSLQKLELELPDIPSDARATETTVCYSSIPLVLCISATNDPNHTFEFDRCSLFMGCDGKDPISDLTVMFTPSYGH